MMRCNATNIGLIFFRSMSQTLYLERRKKKSLPVETCYDARKLVIIHKYYLIAANKVSACTVIVVIPFYVSIEKKSEMSDENKLQLISLRFVRKPICADDCKKQQQQQHICSE